MAIAFNLKVKSANGFSTERVRVNDFKEASKLITTSIKNDITTVKGNLIVETVARHNERVLFQAAMFFQRAVTRTPKDEEYKGDVRGHHIPDDDYVWKHWTIKYWGKKVTAEEMGEELFSDEGLFNDPRIIRYVAEEIKEKLFGGEEKFSKRKTRIRNIRFENEHPRFAMLEYGGYQVSEPPPDKGPLHYHGLQNGYSVQAPHGMLRITQAEMEQMRFDEFDKWLSNFKKNNRGIKRVPSKTMMKKLASVIGDKTHLTTKDIDAITKIYEVG